MTSSSARRSPDRARKTSARSSTSRCGLYRSDLAATAAIGVPFRADLLPAVPPTHPPADWRKAQAQVQLRRESGKPDPKMQERMQFQPENRTHVRKEARAKPRTGQSRVAFAPRGPRSEGSTLK